MRFIKFVGFLSFLFLLASNSTLGANPVPFLSSPLQPLAVAPGSAGFTLTVNGSNFVPGAAVSWNGSARATTFVNSSQLTAVVLASDVATSGTVSVTVTNPAPGGGVSNVLPFEVTQPHTQIPFAATTSVNSGLDNFGAMPDFILPGDFNGDGKMDFITAWHDGFHVLIGNGNGTFAAPVDYLVPGAPFFSHLEYILLGDFNGDGKLDVFVAWVEDHSFPFSYQYSMFLGNGDGTFSTFSAPVSAPVSRAVAVDINRDGKLDIVGVCTDPSTSAQSICVYAGDGTGHFTFSTAYSPSKFTNFDHLAVGDFNRDGKLDIIFSSDTVDVGTPVTLTTLPGNGDGTFGSPKVIYSGAGASGGRGAGLAAADLNSDGFLDIVFSEIDFTCPGATCRTAQVSAFLGNGDGSFQAPQVLPGLDPTAGPLEPHMADLNGDGNLDVVIQNLIVMLHPQGQILPSEIRPAPFNVAAVGDFNGDGRVDLIGPGVDGSHIGLALQVPPTPDFAGSVSPPFQTVTPGTKAKFNITITSVDNFTGTVHFKVTGLPSGATASFNPATVTGSGTSTLSIVTSASTPAGSYRLKLTGSSGALSHTGGVNLNVGPPGTDFTDFTGSVWPSYVNIIPGSFGTFRITLVPENGFFAPVNFSVAGLPAGVIATFASNPLPAGSTSDVLTLSSTASAAPGVYQLTLTASSGSHTHSIIVGLNVGEASGFGDFTGSVKPAALTVSAGATARYTANVVPIYGFTNTVVVSATNLPPDATLVGSPSVFGGSGSVAVPIRTSPATPPGTYTIDISGSSSNANGPLLHGTSVSLTVTPSSLVSIKVSPAGASMVQGSTKQFTAIGTYSNGATLDITSAATWTSSNNAIATVGVTGLVTGVGVGPATITATKGAISGFTGLTVLSGPTNSIVFTGNLTVPRSSHSATLLNNGKVLLVGGYNNLGPGGTYQIVTSAELYDPSTGTFSATGSLHLARSRHAAILLNSGKVLVVGGLDAKGIFPAEAEVYDPASGTFSTTGSLSTARFGLSMAMLPTGKVLVLGGMDSKGSATAVEMYDPASGTFSTVATLPSKRIAFGAATLNNGKLLITGGQKDTGADTTSSWLYDLTSNAISITGSLKVAREGKATVLNSGKALVYGGFFRDAAGPGNFELYDPSTQKFGSLTSFATGRRAETDTLLPNGELLIAGGDDNSINFSKPLAATQLIDTAHLTSAIGPNLNALRNGHTATLLNNGKVLLAGGNGDSNAELYADTNQTLPGLTSIAITLTAPSIKTGAAQRFIATGTFSDGSTQQLAAVVWSSSNSAVAEISNDSTNPGVASAVGQGTTTITATIGSVSKSTVLAVTP